MCVYVCVCVCVCVIFWFYVNVSLMRLWSRLSTQPSMMPVPGFSFALYDLSPSSTLGDCLPFACEE